MMYTLNNDKMLPEIFAETKDVFEKVLHDMETFKEALLLDNEQEKVKAFFEKYSKFQNNGLLIFKTAMGDLCVGLKALGNKFGALGGSSFESLSSSCDQIISSTGNFINYINNFVISTEQIMEKNDKNVDAFNELCENVQNYFAEILPIFSNLSESTMHLYGDAKNRLADKFESVENSLVNFIHMAKIKIVSALATVCIGVTIAYNYFANLVDVKLENLYDVNLLNEQDDVNNGLVKELLTKIIINFEEALNQALKAFN